MGAQSFRLFERDVQKCKVAVVDANQFHIFNFNARAVSAGIVDFDQGSQSQIQGAGV